MPAVAMRVGQNRSILMTAARQGRAFFLINLPKILLTSQTKDCTRKEMQTEDRDSGQMEGTSLAPRASRWVD